MQDSRIAVALFFSSGITGFASEWIGAAAAFGAVVKNP